MGESRIYNGETWTVGDRVVTTGPVLFGDGCHTLYEWPNPKLEGTISRFGNVEPVGDVFIDFGEDDPYSLNPKHIWSGFIWKPGVNCALVRLASDIYGRSKRKLIL